MVRLGAIFGLTMLTDFHLGLVWRSVDEKTIIPVNPSDPIDKKIIETKDICVTGYALAKMQDQPGVVDLLRHTWVYARVSPLQKVSSYY